MLQDQRKITIEIIESKEFHVTAKGYDQHEVDEFLDSICDEIERMEGELESLKRELETARQDQSKTIVRPAPAAPAATANSPASDTFREILEMAQRVKEQTIADAKEQAAKIVEDAQLEIQSRLGSLEEEKVALTAQVDALKQASKDFKSNFAALIKASQDALNLAEDL